MGDNGKNRQGTMGKSDRGQWESQTWDNGKGRQGDNGKGRQGTMGKADIGQWEWHLAGKLWSKMAMLQLRRSNFFPVEVRATFIDWEKYCKSLASGGGGGGGSKGGGSGSGGGDNGGGAGQSTHPHFVLKIIFPENKTNLKIHNSETIGPRAF